MPYIRSIRQYDGFWGIMKLLFCKKPPEAATAVHPLAYFSYRHYKTKTPTGIPCTVTLYTCLRWVGPREPGQLIDLSEAETTEALEAWDREVLWPVMEEGFLGFITYKHPHPLPNITRLRLWRVDRSGRRPVVRTDISGHDTADALNERGRTWRFKNLNVCVMSVRPYEAPDEEILQLLDGRTLEHHSLDVEQFLLPHADDN